MRSSSRVKVDLLQWQPLRAVARWPGFPLVLQVGALAVIVTLITLGLGIGESMSAGELLTLRKTNLTTLVVWGLWWPAMIAAALAFGRAWCAVCPLELVNRIGDALARKLGWPRARLGKLLRAGWVVVAAYLALQLLVAAFSIHRVPHFTALLLLVLLGGALVAGLVFREPRSFCRAFCPASALLSVYGRYTPLQLEVREASTCARCPTRDCVRACRSRLRAFQRRPSDGCVLCLQCAKTCPSGNVGVGLVSSEAPVRQTTLLRPFEAAFVVVDLGFVAHEVIGEVKWLDALFGVVPEPLFLVLFPLLAWATIAGVGYVAGHRAGLRALLLAAATGAAPVVAVAHLAKASVKFTSWSGFLPLALRDPSGVETLRRLADESLAMPSRLVGLTFLGWVMLCVMGVIAWRAWRAARRVPAESAVAARAGVATAAVLFTAVLTLWGWPGR